jgi:uncharacterized protein YkwD
MKHRTDFTLSALLVLLCAAGAGCAGATGAKQGPVAPETGTRSAAKGGHAIDERKPLSQANEATLRQINAYRAQGADCGGLMMQPAAPLVWNDALGRAAQGQAQHLARLGELTHTGADGSNVGQRLTAQGFAWGAAGENAAAGMDSVPGALAQWMSSPGHCRNLMGAQFRAVAMARMDNHGSTYKHYWVMVLGTPMR